MSNDTATTTPTTIITQERQDLIETLQAHRRFLLQTAAGLTDEQARQRSTISELTIGGLIKHVAEVERSWAQFMQGDFSAWPDVDWENPDPALFAAYANGFKLLPDETLAGAIAHYAAVAATTDQLVATLDLDTTYPLPKAPWFPPDGTRSVRRVITHIVAETAQHSGHADIIREAIDGQKTMG